MAMILASSPATAGAPSSIVFAIEWIEGVLLGPLATTFATLAIAWLGFAMLTGRTDWRRGLSVLLGCFILFGAPVIARGLAGLARGGVAAPSIGSEAVTIPPQPKTPPPVDPYAGAAVPVVN